MTPPTARSSLRSPQVHFTRKAAACLHTFIPVCARREAAGTVINMRIRAIIRNFMLHSNKGAAVFYRIRALRERTALQKLTDEEYVMKTYKERFGHEINLEKPVTFGEKLQWLKLFYRNDLMPRCSDKYEVREYLKEIGISGSADLNNFQWIWNK